jgi:hypothetical protein
MKTTTVETNGTIGALICYLWECKLVEPFGKYLSVSKISLPCELAILLLGVSQGKMCKCVF